MIFAFGFSSHADLLVEPYAGYHFGKYGQTEDTEDNVNGVSLGARLGFQSLGFMVGADYMTGSWSDDADPSADVTPSVLGLFVGYNFPVMLRVYGTYGIQNKLKLKYPSSTYNYEGDFLKLGVGFTGLPFVSVNLEYIAASYDEYDDGAVDPAMDSKMFGVTVSLPLTF